MQEFNGNTDKNSVVYHDLNPQIPARYIRFLPVEWNDEISMRVELYGCDKGKENSFHLKLRIIVSNRLNKWYCFVLNPIKDPLAKKN